MQYKNKGPPKRSSIVRQTGICLNAWVSLLIAHF
jgi:hypothetical protein